VCEEKEKKCHKILKFTVALKIIEKQGQITGHASTESYSLTVDLATASDKYETCFSLSSLTGQIHKRWSIPSLVLLTYWIPCRGMRRRTYLNLVHPCQAVTMPDADYFLAVVLATDKYKPHQAWRQPSGEIEARHKERNLI